MSQSQNTLSSDTYRRRSLTVALIAGLIALGAYLLSTQPPSQASGAVDANAPQGPSAGYSVFARERRPADDVTGWRARRDRRNRGIKFDQARVIYSDSARTVAAVPADAGPCLISRYRDGSGGLRCGEGDRPVTTLGYNGALGLVPDSVKTVSFVMADGSASSTNVEKNVWKSPIDAAVAVYDLNGDMQRIQLMPRSSLPEGATLSSDGMVSGGG